MTDLDARAFRKRGKSLVAADVMADEFLDGIRDGAEVLVSVRRPRNPRHHRLLFALLRKVVENTEDWADEEELLGDLKLATGHVERRVNLLTGEAYAVPRSISYASMTQDQFRRWFNRAVHVLATDVLRVAPQALLDEVLAMVDGSFPSAIGRAA